jgi:sortase system peptidoglycan-associated protein
MNTSLKTVKRNNTLVSTLLITSLLSVPSMANEQAQDTATEHRVQQKTENENIGFGTGAVIGALVAGPFGAFVAGVTGVFIAKHMNVNDDVTLLTQDLNQVKTAHQSELEQYQKKLNVAQQHYQTELANVIARSQKAETLSEQLQADNLLMSLQFSTGSSEISAHYQEQVSALAHILNDSPTMKIDLSGYTDLVGETTLNQQLSQARVASVKQLLMAQGVREGQITTFAYGEESPVVATTEQQMSFYDRRVVLKLHNPNNQMAKR